MHAVLIAGTHSGCGKTTLTLGVLAALKKKGLTVQSFKAGPDFIDSGLHRIITGRHSRNLDVWMCGEEYVKNCFYKYSIDADISVIEGVMGMHDGAFSTAHLAGLLNLPVILVVDAYGMAESAGAVVKGFMEYKNPNLIKGIIFNRVASERHFKRLKNSVRGVDVLGYMPRDLNFEIPHRHLGLAVAEENPIAGENIERLADAVLEHIDIDLIINGRLSYCHSERSEESLDSCFRRNDKTHSPIYSFTHSPIIAIAYDRAFCFYYEDNLDLLKNAGAEIVTFSPISDSNIPDNVDAVYIGGGYPELYANDLSKNQSMLEDIYNWADAGKPMYAECGGLMYLSHGIWTNKTENCDNPRPPFFKGEFHKMAGVIPFETQMKDKLSRLGYRDVELNDDCVLGKKGERLRGHEFHYSEIKPSAFSLQPSALTTCYSLFDNNRQYLQNEGYRIENTLASYVHLHFGSNSNIAKTFINFIKE